MAESLQVLRDRWLTQHRKIVAIAKTHRDMNVRELSESLNHLHCRVEYLNRQKDEIEFELGFAIEGVCRVEMLLAGHKEFSTARNPCACIWCQTGSDQNTGLRS